jgi:alpha-tubulin suppressor-like RCC1 family protein
VKSVFSTVGAFAALKFDNTVVAWGCGVGSLHDMSILQKMFDFTDEPCYGDKGGSIINNNNFILINPAIDLTNVETIFATFGAFAALKFDKTVTVWGGKSYGGCDDDSESQNDNGYVYTCKPSSLSNVKTMFSTLSAFAALREDGTVTSWGGRVTSNLKNNQHTYHFLENKEAMCTPYIGSGNAARGRLSNPMCNYGDIPPTNGELTDIKTVFSNERSFVALKNDGTLVGWGNPDFGGVVPDGIKNVSMVFSTSGAYAAIKKHEKVVKNTSPGKFVCDSTKLAECTTSASKCFSSNACENSNFYEKFGKWKNSTYSECNEEKLGLGYPDAYRCAPCFPTSNCSIKFNFSNAILTPDQVVNTVSVWGCGENKTSLGNRNMHDTEFNSVNTQTAELEYHNYRCFQNRGGMIFKPDDPTTLLVSDIDEDPPEIYAVNDIGTLTNVIDIVSTPNAFAALKTDGTVVPWGVQSLQDNKGISPCFDDSTGAPCDDVYVPHQGNAKQLGNVKALYATGYMKNTITGYGAYLALKNDGSIHGFGMTENGAVIQVPASLSNKGQNVVDIAASTRGAFVAVKSCNGDTYTDDNYQCIPCGTGKSTNGGIGNLGKSTCINCPAGKSRSELEEQCQPCKERYYQEKTGKEVCNEVTPGFYLAQCIDNEKLIGCTKVTLCEEGHMCLNGKKQMCLPGTSAAGEGNFRCSVCNKGEYSNVTKATLCTSCMAGYFAGNKNSTSCTKCAPGLSSNEGESFCTPCESGTELQNDICVPCPEGSYSEAGSFCSKCPGGKWTKQDKNHPNGGSYKISSGCNSCIAGKFSAVKGATSKITCTNCSVGKFSTAIGADSSATCNDCAPGKFSNTKGASNADTCAWCNDGYVAPDAGSSECILCEAGKAPNSVTRSSCVECQGGKYLDDKTKECVECEAGFACPPGEVKVGCNVGEYANKGKAECSNCDLGTFNLTPNQGTCTSCPEGTYQDARGQTTCVSCPM